MSYSICYSCLSHRGLVRRNNQDNILICREYMDPRADAEFSIGGVLSGLPQTVGVYDGLGGEELGEVAAFIAAKEAAAMRTGADPEEDLRSFCRRANAGICRYADENGVSSMGTTAAMLVFNGKRVTAMNVGDSRIYRLSGGHMRRVSVDHVFPFSFGRKPPLTQNLGIPENLLRLSPEIRSFPAVVGDRYLICSDGLTDMVDEERIRFLLEGCTPDIAANALLCDALRNGGRDNITLAVLNIVEDK